MASTAAFFALSLLFLMSVSLGPATACTFAGGTVPAPCTFTIDAVESQCIMDITTVTVTSLMDNNRVNESATYVDTGSGRMALVAKEDKPINTGQSMTLYSVRDTPLPAGASATVVVSGISDTKTISTKACNCPIIIANTTASFNPDSGMVFANGTIRGTCMLSGIVSAILNRTTGLAVERMPGSLSGGAFSLASSNTYTSDAANRELQVFLLAYGYNGALGAYLPPIGSFKDFDIAIPKASIVAEPGKPADVTISVTNFNNEPDTYTVTTNVPQDWSGESVVFSLGPNSASNQQVIRITPSLLSFSETQSIVVSVTSSSTGKTKTAAFRISPSDLKPTLQSYLYPPNVVMIGRLFDAKAVLNATSPSTVRYFFYTEPFVNTDSSGGKTSIPAGLSSMTAQTTVRDICTLPDSAKSLRKMNVYWSVLWDVLPAKNPTLIKKVLSKIDTYKGTVTISPSFSATRSNVSAIVSSLELHQNVDSSRIVAILSDIETLKTELDFEENKTLASPAKTCKPVANVDLVLDFISYSDASESMAIGNNVAFASGEVLSARLLDENGNAVPTLNMGPGDVKELRAEITNGDTDTRQFTVGVTDGVLANFITLAESQVTIGGGQTGTVGITVQMPTVISGTKNATVIISSSPYIKSLPIIVTMSGPELSGPASYVVEPGVPATFSFFLKNNDAKSDDTYSISVAGGTPEMAKWFSVPATLKVAAGKEAKVQVKASTPSAATLGTYNFTLVAYSQKSGDSARFDVFLLLSGEFKIFRAQASGVDAINAQIKAKCPGTATDAAILKDARSLITAGKLSEAKAKLDLAASGAEATLSDCTSFKMPFTMIMLVLGGLAVAYFWFFVRKPAPPMRPPSQTGRLPLSGGGATPSDQRGGTELPTGSSKDDEETWI